MSSRVIDEWTVQAAVAFTEATVRERIARFETDARFELRAKGVSGLRNLLAVVSPLRLTPSALKRTPTRRDGCAPPSVSPAVVASRELRLEDSPPGDATDRTQLERLLDAATPPPL
jgi:hypothetical protein